MSASEVGARWDQKYTSKPRGFGEQPNAFLEQVADRIAPNSLVIVPGDGYGRNGLWLARRGNHVLIVELSEVGLKLARKTAEQENLNLDVVQADLAEWTPPACDAYVSIFVHLQPEARRHMHHAAAKALRPGGLIIMEAFNPDQRKNERTSGGPRSPELLYTPEMLREDFAELEIELLTTETVELHEGDYHSGTADVVRLLAARRER